MPAKTVTLPRQFLGRAEIIGPCSAWPRQARNRRTATASSAAFR